MVTAKLVSGFGEDLCVSDRHTKGLITTLAIDSDRAKNMQGFVNLAEKADLDPSQSEWTSDVVKMEL